MSTPLKAILLLALVCFASTQDYDHVHDHDEENCNHNDHQEQNPPELLDIEEDFRVLESDSGRVLAAEDYPPIRIYANYDNVIKTASSSYASYIKDELVPGVISYFQSTLKVKYPVAGNLVLSSSVKTLCDLSTPAALKTGVAADYAYLVTTKSESGGVLATSWNCNLASGSKRPLVGSTSFNRNSLKEAKGDAIVHEKNMYLLMHEMMHTLGFSKSLHKYFIDAKGKTLSGHVKSAKIGGETLPVIDVPSLTQKLREFHGCSTLPGAIMASGDASHWNKKLYLYETMQSGAIDGKRISELSLALLEASGWYAIDYTKAEPYFYGQGQGCNFINGVCSSSSSAKPAFDEFCSGSSRGCNFMGNSGGSCSTGSHMGNCKYMLASSSSHCEGSGSSAKLKSIEAYGRDSGSRCFTGTLSSKSSTSTSSFCFKYNCVGEGINTQVEVLLGTKKALCTKKGTATVSGYYGVINCPDPMTFCNTAGKKFCPKSCLGRGQCVDNKCICNPGFKGIDCAFNA